MDERAQIVKWLRGEADRWLSLRGFPTGMRLKSAWLAFHNPAGPYFAAASNFAGRIEKGDHIPPEKD